MINASSCKIFYILSHVGSTDLKRLFAFRTVKTRYYDIFVLFPFFALLEPVFMRLPEC